MATLARTVGSPGRPCGDEVDDRAAAEVLDEERAAGVGERGERARIGPLDEAGLPEVARVYAEDRRGDAGAVGERRLVVGEAGAVGGADLDELGAGAGADVGHAEAAADLDELAARDEHPAPGGERAEGEQRRRGVVVDDERRLGARELGEARLRERGARAAPAGGEVDLDRGVPARRGGERLRGGLGEGGAAEVGVEDDAGRVHHGPGARRERRPGHARRRGPPPRRASGTGRRPPRARASSIARRDSRVVASAPSLRRTASSPACAATRSTRGKLAELGHSLGRRRYSRIARGCRGDRRSDAVEEGHVDAAVLVPGLKWSGAVWWKRSELKMTARFCL